MPTCKSRMQHLESMGCKNEDQTSVRVLEYSKVLCIYELLELF